MQNAATGAMRHVESAAVSTGVNESGCLATPASCESASASETTPYPEVRWEAPASTAVSTTAAAGASASQPVLHTTGETRSSVTVSKRDVLANPTVSQLNVRVRSGECSVKNDQVVVDPEWQIVRKKSAKRYKLIGQRGCASTAPEVKFKAADLKVPLLISNVSKEASVSDIISYIKEKTDESVSLKNINLAKRKII